MGSLDDDLVFTIVNDPDEVEVERTAEDNEDDTDGGAPNDD